MKKIPKKIKKKIPRKNKKIKNTFGGAQTTLNWGWPSHTQPVFG
jgi:hypothetical protein